MRLQNTPPTSYQPLGWSYRYIFIYAELSILNIYMFLLGGVDCGSPQFMPRVFVESLHASYRRAFCFKVPVVKASVKATDAPDEYAWLGPQYMDLDRTGGLKDS